MADILKAANASDRGDSIEPKIVGKRQSRTCSTDDKILYIYARGQSTRDIAETIQELYKVTVSPSLICRVTDRVNQTIEDWKRRPLDTIHHITAIAV